MTTYESKEIPAEYERQGSNMINSIVANSLAFNYQKLSEEKFNYHNKQLYYRLKETSSNEEEYNFIFIGKQPKNFDSRIDDNDLEIISEILLPFASSITNIDLSNNFITEKSMSKFGAFISNCKNLKSLNLQYNHIGPNGCNKLLEGLVNSKKKGNDKFKYLNLEGCRVQTKGLMQIDYKEKLYNQRKTLIQEFLEDNQSLEEFYIGENEIDETGLIELFSLLNSNVNLFSLRNLCIDAPFKMLFTEETAYQLSRVLKTNKYLEKLSIRKSGLSDEGLIIIIKEVLENDNLRVLDLGGNLISYKGCEYLSKYLGSPYCVLQSLILNNNQIRDYGVKKLLKGLTKNETLVHLNLNNNGLSDIGLLGLAKMLKKNEYLISLNLFWNDFEEKSMKEFYDLIQNSSRGIHLDFCVEKSQDESYKIYFFQQNLPENIFVTKKHFIKEF